MYKVRKEKGNNVNILVANTDTSAEIIIGRLNMQIIRLLESEGIKFDTDDVKLTDEWNFDVSPETAKALSKLAMPMKKPIRAKIVPEVTVSEQKSSKQVDAMDVLLGLATY